MRVAIYLFDKGNIDTIHQSLSSTHRFQGGFRSLFGLRLIHGRQTTAVNCTLKPSMTKKIYKRTIAITPIKRHHTGLLLFESDLLSPASNIVSRAFSFSSSRNTCSSDWRQKRTERSAPAAGCAKYRKHV